MIICVVMETFIFSIVFIVIFKISRGNANCQLPCPFTRPHPLCLDQYITLVNFEGYRIDSAAFTESLLNLHNDFRNKLAREGYHGQIVGNMRKLRWDEELGNFVFNWVTEGYLSPTNCRYSKKSKIVLNFGLIETNVSAQFVFDEWTSPLLEKGIHSTDSRSLQPSHLRVVWPETERLGCIEMLLKLKKNKKKQKRLVCCGYSPGPGPNDTFSPQTKCPVGTRNDQKTSFLCTPILKGPNTTLHLNWKPTIDYCQFRCPDQNVSTHTMCLYSTPGDQCDNLIGKYPGEKDSIKYLQWHNVLRNTVASGALHPKLPRAANMRLMTWDYELSVFMHTWLIQCYIGTDDCRDTEDFRVVQLIGHSKDHEANSKDIFYEWVDELTLLQKTSIAPNPKRPKYISQILWADTYKLGCSEVTFGKGDYSVRFFGCNYGPGGNLRNGSVYLNGTTCSMCPGLTKCHRLEQYPFLCVTLEDANSYRRMMGSQNRLKSTAALIIISQILAFI